MGNGENLNFHFLTVNEGLSQHDITDITEDSFGFIWIATYDGLNRYDGKSIQIFRHKTRNHETLSGNRVMCIMEDSSLRIWIGTDGYGINYYSLPDGNIVRISTPENCRGIFAFAEDDRGNIYAGSNNGLLIVDAEKGESELMQTPVAGLAITDMTVLNGVVFIATNQGVWALDGDKCSLVSAIPQGNYIKIVSDGQSNILAATTSHVIRVSPSIADDVADVLELSPGQIIRSMFYAKSDRLMLGTESHGILVADPGLKIEEAIVADPQNHRGLHSNCITSILVDAQNILWVGTNSGFYFADFNALPFNTFPLVPGDGQIGFIYAGDDYVYISRGMTQSSCYQIKNMRATPLPATLPSDIKEVVEIGGLNYIAAASGLYVQRSPGVHSYGLYPVGVKNDPSRSDLYTSLAVDKYGNKYIGTWRGLIIERGRGNADWIDYLYPKADILYNVSIYDIFYDDFANCVWIGTVTNGLFRLNLDDTGEMLSIQHYHTGAKTGFFIPSNQVWTIFRSDDGTLWLGTDAGLLCKNQSDEFFVQIDADGVLDMKIVSVMEDKEGCLWMGNTQGLIRYSPATGLSHRFTYDNGLQSNTFTEGAAKTREGILLFGGLEGVNWFDPANIIMNDVPARIIFTDIRVNNKRTFPTNRSDKGMLLDSAINIKRSLELKHFQNDFVLEFGTVPFGNIKEYNVRYKLKGIDNDWTDSSSTNMMASYKNLPAGQYRFIVESYGTNGSGNPVSLELAVRVKPAPWFSWWAYVLYAAALTTVVYLIINAMGRHRNLMHQMEIDKTLREQEEKINELKLMFFTDIAHEFKTPLSLIVGPVNDLLEGGAENENQRFCFNVISRNVCRMMFLVNQLLDFRKITKGRYALKVAELDLAALVWQVSKAFAWEANREEVNFDVNTPEEFKCHFDPDMIEKVLYNILSNAFRYTKTRGIVEVNLRSVWKNGELIAEISVADNGPGIDDEMKPHVFERFYHGTSRLSSGVGLHLSEQLIKEHHGEINLTDSVYKGAEFIISFPVSATAYSENEFKEYQDEKGNLWAQEEIHVEEKITEKGNADERDKLLIVEDNIDLRYYLRKCLASKYITYEARNGAEGLQKAAQIIPDLIISDIMMPEMDGLEMARAIKRDEALSHIPIILLTAKTDVEQQKEGFEAGVLDYICKPFNTRLLLTKIDNLINQQVVFRKHVLGDKVLLDLNKNYTPYDKKLIEKLNDLIVANINDGSITVDFLAKEMNMSRMQLHRKIKSLTGKTSTSYINLIRMRYAREMFDKGCDRVQEVMDEVGISSNSYFNKLFKSYYEMTPSVYIYTINRKKRLKDTS